MSEAKARADLVQYAKSLFDRGYSVGSSGNISVAIEDGFLMTPTNSCLGFLEIDRIAKLDCDWLHVGGDKPSKEIFLHRAFYETRPGAGAIVHLHSTFATAVSCLADVDPEDTIPALTPYVAMRVGRVPLIPYVHPGNPQMGDLIRDLGGTSAAVLLANHGPVVAARDLASAVFAIEELEETAKLSILLRGCPTWKLGAKEVQELVCLFGTPS